MMTVKLKLIILLDFFLIIGELHATQYIQRGDLYCEVTTCNKNETDTHVVPCQKNGTRDTCSRCPPGTELKDIIHSRPVNIPCRTKKTCSQLEGTKEVDYPVSCPPLDNYFIHCECDVSKNYCGVDPCNCIKKYCPFGQILQNDCGCNYPETPKRTSLPPPKPIRTTRVTRTMSADTTTATSSASTSQQKSPQNVTKTTLPQDVTKTTRPPEDSSEYSLHTDSLLLAFLGILVTATIICCIWLKCRKRERSARENIDTGNNPIEEDDLTKNVGNQEIEDLLTENVGNQEIEDLLTENVGNQEIEDLLTENVGNQEIEDHQTENFGNQEKIIIMNIRGIYFAQNVQHGDYNRIKNEQPLLRPNRES